MISDIDHFHLFSGSVCDVANLRSQVRELPWNRGRSLMTDLWFAIQLFARRRNCIFDGKPFAIRGGNDDEFCRIGQVAGELQRVLLGCCHWFCNTLNLADGHFCDGEAARNSVRSLSFQWNEVHQLVQRDFYPNAGKHFFHSRHSRLAFIVEVCDRADIPEHVCKADQLGRQMGRIQCCHRYLVSLAATSFTGSYHQSNCCSEKCGPCSSPCRPGLAVGVGPWPRRPTRDCNPRAYCNAGDCDGFRQPVFASHHFSLSGVIDGASYAKSLRICLLAGRSLRNMHTLFGAADCDGAGWARGGDIRLAGAAALNLNGDIFEKSNVGKVSCRLANLAACAFQGSEGNVSRYTPSIIAAKDVLLNRTFGLNDVISRSDDLSRKVGVKALGNRIANGVQQASKAGKLIAAFQVCIHRLISLFCCLVEVSEGAVVIIRRRRKLLFDMVQPRPGQFYASLELSRRMCIEARPVDPRQQRINHVIECRLAALDLKGSVYFRVPTAVFFVPVGNPNSANSCRARPDSSEPVSNFWTGWVERDRRPAPNRKRRSDRDSNNSNCFFQSAPALTHQPIPEIARARSYPIEFLVSA